jgi:hypothetical protein
MLDLFGGYDGGGLRNAPARLVEEQRIVWVAERRAAAELEEKRRRETQ